MKKIALVLVLFALATGAFAQKISLDGHLSTCVFFPVSDSGVVMPSIGVAVDVGPVDILGNIELWISSEKTKSGSGDETHRRLVFGMYAGVAPKIMPVDKLTLSFPCFLKIYIIGEGMRYSYTVLDETPKRYVRGGFGFEAGARTTYAFTPNWGVYLGAQAELMSYYGKGRNTNFGGKKSDGTTSNLYWFDTGSIDLGIKYTFNP